MRLPVTRWCLLSVAIVACCAGGATARPNAMDLFPNETLAFGRVAHFRDLFSKLQQSSMGRLLQDPALQPFIDDLYGAASDAYAEDAEERVGLSLEQLKSVPQGEFAIGLIGRQAGNPTFAVLLDMGDEPEAARALLERVEELMVSRGGRDKTTQTFGATELTILTRNSDNALVYFERENTLVICGDLRLAQSMLAFWDGQSPPLPVEEEDDTPAGRPAAPDWQSPLSANPDFVAIMRTCRNPGDPPPQILFFVDPIEIFRQLNRGNVGAQVALATLPSLGLDRFDGVGGSLTFATDRYDDITHIHLLLDNPRSGVLTLLNLTSGETTPERFVPSEWIDTYITLNWNIPLTYEKLILLYDKFQYPGAFEGLVQENIDDEVGIDFQADVIEQLTGRVSATLGFSPPARAGRRSVLVSLHVADVDQAEETLLKVLEGSGEPFDSESYGGVDYWVLTPPPFRDLPVEDRPFEACFSLLEGCFLFANDRHILERAVAARDGTAERLADSLDFKLVHSRIGRFSDEPGMILFNRPEVGLRYMYELVNSDDARAFLSEQREDNQFFRTLDDALASHPLPAFEVLAKYFAPSGGFLSDTATGLHYYQFSLRRE